MASVVRPIGFSNSLQQLVWPTTTSQITAYLWGGGGGGGGNDSHPGGYGSGSGFTKKTFTINDGDTLQVAVGGGGGAGRSGTQGGGGSAGPSYTTSTVWTTLNLTGSPYIRVTNGAYCGFLNTYGVWNYTPDSATFDHTVVINFASSGYYTVTGSCDNYATIYVDGTDVLDIPGFFTTYSNSFYVTAGNHNVRLSGVNTGGPASLGVTITGGSSFGGGQGGGSGYGGSSGAGGGGGGASALILNGTVIAVAGGGGGGGGGGNAGAANGQNAPGSSGQTTAGTYAGQNGQDKYGDGGGGGAGGGGYAAGQGGGTPGGDAGAYAGYYGSNLGDVVADPNGRTPGGTDQPYFSSSIGYGGYNTGGGSSGYIVLDMNIGGGSVKYNGDWANVQKTYVKNNGIWQPVQATYVKNNGNWAAINGSFAPAFTTVSGYWGTDPRGYS